MVVLRNPIYNKCLACQCVLHTINIGEYSCCMECGSYTYISNKIAEDDNKSYFEKECAYEFILDPVKKGLGKIAHLLEYISRKTTWCFRTQEKRLQQLLLSSGQVLEIGFGDGHMLLSLLSNGVNAFGIELSEKAVENFKIRHPQYANRVSVKTTPSGKWSAIYASALFEHLDNPDEFLRNVGATMNQNGYLIMGLPVVSSVKPTIEARHDINFWSPCHRVVYSKQGLEKLFERNNFKMTHFYSVDLLEYRCMNELLRNGCHIVREIRTPYNGSSDFPNRADFFAILITAMKMKSVSVWARVIAQVKGY